MTRGRAAGDRRGRIGNTGNPSTVIRAGNPRVARLDAIAVVRLQPDAATMGELRRVATDGGDDAIVRAVAVAVLAEHGEVVITESNPPAVVAAAQKRGAEVVHTRQLVGAFERGERSHRLPPAALLASPTTGTKIVLEVPNPQVHAQVAAAVSIEPSWVDIPTALQVIVVRCGANELAIVVDPAQLKPSSLLAQPARLGRLAVHQTLEQDDWTFPYDILTEPDLDGIRIGVLDRRGRPRFAGAGQLVEAEVIAFTVQRTDEPGATPIAVEGRIDERGTLSINEGLAGDRATAPRRPKPIRGS